MAFVSIVIPTYNRALYILETVNSALLQDNGNAEVIVIDDGSTDTTREVLKEHIDTGRIVYVWKENTGRAEARNCGAKMSKGQFLLFLDSDDVLHGQAVENLKKLYMAHPSSGIFGGRVVFFSNTGHYIAENSFNPSRSFADTQVISDVTANVFLSTGGYMIRREFFFKDGGFEKKFEPAEDLDFSIKTLHANLYTWSEDFVVVNKRRHEGNTEDAKLYESSYKTCIYYLQLVKKDKLPNFVKERSRLLSNLYERLLKDCINLAMKRKGVSYFWKMVIKNRRKIFSPDRWKLLAYLLLFSGRNKRKNVN